MNRSRDDGPGAVHSLDLPLADARIPGLSVATAAKLARGLEIRNVRDLLEHVPRRYLDLSKTRAIRELRIGEEATTAGAVVRVDGRYVRSKRHLLTVTISDGTGYLDLVWWNQAFRARAFSTGEQLAVAGRIERNRGRLGITNPFVEPIRGETESVHVGRIIPIHGATQGVTPTQIRRFVHEALRRYGRSVSDPLPQEVIERKTLVPKASAIAEMHFPTGREAFVAARRRLVFEELFVLSAGLAMRKLRIEREAKGIVHDDAETLVRPFLESLPFEPTGAQRRAMAEIAGDMAKPHPMNRLLQGEVGSGKTVVALAAALVAAASGSQTAFMAPTEVLAEQHFLSVRRLLEPLKELAPTGDRLFAQGFEVALLTGGSTARERASALELAATGRGMMLVGTHALIQEGVEFERLGLAVIDEQHRFGVHQRVSLRSRSRADAQPDVLIMTATPIPRTLALTLYGDLDVSVLDEMPKGRTPVETVVVSDSAGRAAAYEDIRAEVGKGHQVFIVCPLVEESSASETKAAESEYERIATEVFPDLRVRLVHGRMKSHVKDETMNAMRAGEVDVLVATTVIEVGIDVPNATRMVIEDADRFGLSQLHQLRGRIGRGSAPSRCYLFSAAPAEEDESRREALQRLAAMARTTDGFELAELDLEMRGAGQLLGRGSMEEGSGAPAQAGRTDLRFANLPRDLPTLLEARRVAFAIVEGDPTLTASEHRALLDEVRRRFADRLEWLFAS